MTSTQKVIILAGGLGTRLSEETIVKPKPMVEIGGKPILWHIMKIYSYWGFNEFIICLGYKGYLIKEYFYNYFLHQADVTINLVDNQIKYQNAKSEPWLIHLIDTGDLSMTGGRIKRVGHLIMNDELFLLTYGDALTNLNIPKTIQYHRESKKIATLTAVSPPARFGNLVLSDAGTVSKFSEKSNERAGLINGGFFVLSPKVLDYIENDDTVWEKYPLTQFAENDNLGAYIHNGFWQPMDTLYEKNLLESLWNSGKAPWKIWD